MLRDYLFPAFRLGRYEVRAYFEPRSFGVLIRWGRLSSGVCVIAHLGPFGAYAEPYDD